MKIITIPEGVLCQWEAKKYVVANHCFANCSRLVFHLPTMGIGYVLCWVNVDGQRYPHAVISCGDNNFDPTLQRSTLQRTYEFVRRYTRAELIKIITDGGGEYDDANGVISGIPPALCEDGTIACVEVELSSPQT
ncbi:hypothetical protein QT199_014330 [Xanthomonas phaseoli pv. phaseoli]|uniref:Uncharacterized protein n=1 Tax=Xanthomonas campestris pv. phaseoli TaxID=317013 RepID=A0AB38E2E1_XANCH|nr:hypothetical protein [Xanthomonas phaseoli]MBO9734570.1 hypothetical protein [Xanthomonas phaseoli pv. phaseoli]MDM4801301.1 hypothetical protein [Xanthomonas phaseoli pv. phaseoli]MDM4806325.1 hypothetical protein [Xanthomonas phaseoli pv. phaseoli]MDM4810377.1 hypothetical protein [Xanthomonas phaseoli pv. phaseoli]QTG35337.1 hypothetical protein XppCFBP412P_23100 [Xanthomonas phaseoli pv. phaseoli]